MSGRTFWCAAPLIALLALTGCAREEESQPMDVSEFTTTDERVGSGNEAVAGRQVTVHYTGWLYDSSRPDNKGTKFDSSRDGNEPFSFRLGAGRVIQGWDQGVAGMKVGGRRTLTIPSKMGYGTQGAPGAIPPNAALVFDVELLDVK